MSEIQKVIRNGEVAILYSPGFGASWYTWNTEFPQCIFDPEIVAMVEAGADCWAIEEATKAKYGEGFYAGGADSLTIEWLPVGTPFFIREYDGSESVVTTVEFMTA